MDVQAVHILITRTSAAVNIRIHAVVWVYFQLSWYLPRCGISGSWWFYLTEQQPDGPTTAAHVPGAHRPRGRVQFLHVPAKISHFPFFFFLNYSHPGGYETVLHCSSDLRFPHSWWRCVLRFLVTISAHSLQKCLLESSAHAHCLFGLSLSSCKNSSYIWYIEPFFLLLPMLVLS